MSCQSHYNTHLVDGNLYLSFNQAGQSALMMAADAGHESVVTLLLEAKAQVNLANSVSRLHASEFDSSFDRQ